MVKDNEITLALVVPCYNEEAVLHDTTAKLSEVLNAMETDGSISSGKIIYVDDGSHDATWQIIKQLSAESSRIVGLKLAHNVGHQNA